MLFTLLAERYERGSVLLDQQPAVLEMGSIFKDPMTTAAAIDRLVHHSVIVELNVPSYRLEQARNNVQALGQEPAAARAPVNRPPAPGFALRLQPLHRKEDRCRQEVMAVDVVHREK